MSVVTIIFRLVVLLLLHTLLFFVPGNARQDEAIVTYGDLIDLYESVMISATSAEGKQSQDLFIEGMHESFPGYHLSRPKGSSKQYNEGRVLGVHPN